jgi:CheY-like chemotaxis protein
MQSGHAMTEDLDLATAPAGEAPLVEAWPSVGIVEDDPTVAALALEMCRGLGANAALFPSATPFLQAYSQVPPRAVVLDWRLEREVGAAAFMAIRHRFPRLPVVCWTASPDGLPTMIRHDPLTRVVPKSAGLAAFESALAWALAEQPVINGHG